jgi:hypothetical protein
MYPGTRRHRLRIAVAIVAGVLGLTAFLLVAEVGAGPHPAHENTNPPPVPDLFGTPAASSPAKTPLAVPAGPVQVVQGTDLVNGVYLGYPHTITGAISAADQFAIQLGSTLDPGQVAAVMRLVADPSYPQGPQQFAAGMAGTRTDLGIPASGPVPDGDSLVLEPAEYQLRDASADQVTVLLLSDFIATTVADGTQSQVGVYPLRMHWTDGDWKILAPGSTDYSGLAADPDSSQAVSKGWQEVSP